jgi:signal transduction histidine kinase
VKIEAEELGRLTGGLAHEIKNPLSTININLKLIREELEAAKSEAAQQANQEQKNHRFTRVLKKLAVIEKEADRLEQILEDFLRYIGKTELQLSDVDISSLMSDMIDFYSPQARSHTIIIRQQLYDKPLVCKADEGMLKQLILNLFINAQQAMSEGGELLIRTARGDKEAVIQISDTGCGITPDRLPKIFDVYYSSRSHGSGLGLPTAKKIVEMHKGTISVDSEPGKGTSFTIKLPLSNL